MDINADRLKKACAAIEEKDVAPYSQLRAWLTDASKRNEFTNRFKSYYGLNSGGLTDDWKAKYFDVLFSLDLGRIADPYTPVLKELYKYKRKQGDQVLSFSFVSKLVAIHDESRPLYDKHVSAFFGLAPPTN